MTATAPLPLKYLFGAQFTDGSEYFQTPDDSCARDPKRTAFYGLLQVDDNGDPIIPASGGLAETRSDIAVFQLEQADGTRYVVDLRDGHFEVQIPKGRGTLSRSFWISEPPMRKTLKLFYFRRRRHHAKANISVDMDGNPSYTNIEDAGQECEYHFGWETEDRSVRAEMILT